MLTALNFVKNIFESQALHTGLLDTFNSVYFCDRPVHWNQSDNSYYWSFMVKPSDYTSLAAQSGHLMQALCSL